MAEKLVYSIKDMEKMLGVKYGVASRAIREARAYQDNLKVSGRILKSDWEAYVNRSQISKQGGDKFGI